ncbi:hypothetical protein LJC06_03695 [Bacteroidales bacterium OttesenSCG-928-I14]|nr:hypothetical protein [Bacteroidales bacterium OttesenSCG-928-I14]
MRITSGTYSIRSYDYLYIYNGSGTGGTSLGTYTDDDNGTVSATQSTGQYLTIRFTSNGIYNRSGFAINVETFDLPITPSAGGVVYVRPTAQGTGLGDSWTNATTLQRALKAAETNTSIDKIYVYKGDYYPTTRGTSADRTATFTIPAGVKIYGGFNSITETEGNRTATSNLDGNINTSNEADAYHVVTISGDMNGAVLDRFVVRNGRATGMSDKGFGAGIYMTGTGNITLNNVRVYNNIANYRGAGIYLGSDAVGSSPIFKTLTVENNSGATYGKDVYIGRNAILQGVSKLGTGVVNGEYCGVYFEDGDYLTVTAGNTGDGIFRSGTSIKIEDADDYSKYVVSKSDGNNITTTELAYFATDTDKFNLRLAGDKIYLDEKGVRPNASGIVYVKTTATGTKSGNSWDNAADLQEALTAAKTNTDIKKIYVRDGVYKPTTTSDRAITFKLPAGVKIYGGFASDSQNEGNRNGTSTLSGDINTSNNNDSYHVVWAQGDMEDAVLDRFTITGGRANGGGTDDYGGGIYLFTVSNFTINNVIVTANYALDGGAGIHFGSGASTPTLSNVTIQNNTSEGTSGGLTISAASAPILSNVTINNNNATGLGKDVYAQGSFTLNGTKSIIGTNATKGIYFEANKKMIVDPTALVTNTKFYIEDAATKYAVVAEKPSGEFTEAEMGTYFVTDATKYQFYLFGGKIYMRPPITNSAIVYVKKGATGNGSAWNNALPELAFALLDKPATMTTVYVAAGTYSPMFAPESTDTPGNQDRTFLLLNNVKIYGGFAGSGTESLDSRNFTANQTTLSGAGYCYHVVSSVGNVGNACLDGFTISGGRSVNSDNYTINGVSCYRALGGGIMIVDSSPALTNLIVTANTSSRQGAGIFMNENSNPTLTNVDSYGNKASNNQGHDLIFGQNIIISGKSHLGTGVVGTDYRGIYLGAKMIINNNALVAGTKFYIESAITMYSVVAEKASGSFTETEMNTYFETNQSIYRLYLQDGKIYIRPVTTPASGIVYVKKGATGNGSAWNNALPELAFALLDKPTAMNTVYVAKGNYQPMYLPTPSDANLDTDKTFLLLNNVKIYGGFAGNNGETVASRDFTTNETVLDGADTYTHVVVSAGDVGSACLDGFTIKNGVGLTDLPRTYITVNGVGMISRLDGAGIFNSYSSPAYSNLIIKENVDGGSNGAGMYNHYSNPVLTNVKITDNTSASAAGMLNFASSPVLNNVEFSSNLAHVNGGAMGNTDYSYPVLNNVKIVNNQSYYIGGGIYNMDAVSYPVFNNNVEVSNNTGTEGQDIYSNSSFAVNSATKTILGTADDKGIYLAANKKIIVNPSALVTGTKFHIEGAAIMLTVVAEKTSGNFTDDELKTYFSTDGAKYKLFIQNGKIYIRLVTTPFDGIAYVKKGGAGNMTGNSWANAAPELAHALKDAQNPLLGINTIYVAKGTYEPMYKPASTSTSDDNDKTFFLAKDVKVYGGFAGNDGETLADRDFVTNETILDGDDTYYHVVLSVGNVGIACLDGFTVTGGKANGSSPINVNGYNIYQYNGAGIYNSFSSPVLTNVSIKDNTASNNGGGMYNYSYSSSPVLTNVLISDNIALGYGGGIANHYSKVTLINTTVAGNKASSAGAAGIDNDGDGIVNIQNSIVYGNITSSLSPSPIKVNADNSSEGEPEMASRTARRTNTHSGAKSSNQSNIYIFSGSANISYTIVGGCGGSGDNWNTSMGTDGGNNLDVDPIFTNPASGNYSLAAGSCAINAGKNELYLSARGVADFTDEKDVLSNTRLVDTRIDMGAIESSVVFDPTIVANPTSVDFGTFIVGVDTETTIDPAFIVSGSDLFGSIYLDLSQVHNLYSIVNDLDEIEKDCPGYSVTNFEVGATFNPALFGRHEATVTLSTEEGDDVEVNFLAVVGMDLAHYDYKIEYLSCDSFVITLPDVPGVERFELMVQGPNASHQDRTYYYSPDTPMTIGGLEENTEYKLHIHLQGNNHDVYFWLPSVTTPYCPEWTVSPDVLADLEVRVDELGSAVLTVDGKGIYNNIEVSIAGAPEFTLTSNEIDVNNGDIFQDMTTVEFVAAHPGIYTATITFTSTEIDARGNIVETFETREIKAVARPLPVYTPVALAASDVTCEGFTANWEKLLDENTNPAEKYNISLYKEGVVVEDQELGSDVLSYVFTGLEEETEYSYIVRAFINGVLTDDSEEIFVETIVCPVPELTWVGTEDSNWNNANNWEPKRVPGTDAIVTISKDAANYPVLDTNETVADIHFEAGAELGRHDLLTYSRADIQLDMNGKTDRWNMYTIPVTGIYSGDLSFGGFPYTYLRHFSLEEDNDGMTYADWSKDFAANSDVLEPGEGFFYYINPEGTAFGNRYTGYGRDSQISVANRNYGLGQVGSVIQLPFHENKEISDAHRIHKFDERRNQSTFYYFNNRGLLINPKPEVVSREGAYRLVDEQVFSKDVKFADLADKDGDFMALVGNPFMSTIDFDALYNDNLGSIKNAYHVFTGSSFSTYDAEGGSGLVNPGKYIAPMQSFLVEKGSLDKSDVQLFFDAEIVTATGKGELKAQINTNDKLVITASNEHATVRTYIATRDQVNSTRKLMTEVNEVPEIYTLQGDKAVGGQTITENNALIPVGVKTSYEGNITMTLSGMDTYDAQITLIDMAEGRHIDLTGQASFEYIFAGESSDSRFYIEINPAPTSLDAVDGQILVYADNKTINVVSGSEIIKEVYVINQQGQTVYGINTLNTNNYKVESLAQQAEIYIVKVVTENGVINKKVMLK